MQYSLVDAGTKDRRPVRRSSESEGGRSEGGCGGRYGLLAVVLYLLLAFVKALRNRRSPWYQRGLIREPLGKIGVVLLHDVERGFPGEPAMELGKESVHFCELFVGHERRALAAMLDYTATG
ncbi:hypothetical protein JQ628_21345 [Bradyrhizobium lablabi]|uniref:hypothetical protein n=1 Tax=Bradyrhizobium lablabi TaxID=722472 RepID=UPI001BA86EE4|nr:hypothetical protein [Bradyrhizobium lablabi]MBR1124089.1 hypothetical protein [Bradyrhizobium lablabi]